MQPHSRLGQGYRRAASEVLDPAVVTSQVLANAQPYDHFNLEASPPPVCCPPVPDQPFTAYPGGIAPFSPIWSNIDALGCPTELVKLHVPPSATIQGPLPAARHEYGFLYETCPVWRDSAAVQPRIQSLPQSGLDSGTDQLNASSTNQRHNAEILGRLLVPDIETASNGQPSKHRNGGTPPKPSSSLSFNDLNQPKKYSFLKCPTEDAAPSVLGAQVCRTISSTSASNREYMWLEHGQKDPTVRSLPPRSNADNNRIDAMNRKGGACGPCRRSKKQCDESDHCQRCIHSRIPSEAQFLASLAPVSYPAGLENISLYNIESSPPIHSRPLAHPNTAAMLHAQAQATNHVNSWFKNVTRMIDPKPYFKDLLEPLVSLDITSGFGDKSKTFFSLEYVDISSHLEHTAYQLDEELLLAGFVAHGRLPTPQAPKNGQSRSQCVNHLSWAVSNAFAFLRSFAEAEVYASISNMSTAKASISIVYASLYRLLLAKSDELCIFILKLLSQNFLYCTRRSRKDVIEDSLRGLAQYYRVVTELANLELRSSPEVTELFSDLKSHAQTLLRRGGVKRLYLRIVELAKSVSARSLNHSSHLNFKGLISLYASEVQEIKPLSIALRVNSGAHHLRPVSTEVMRDNDPYHQNRPIKVRDLLEERKDLVMDPKQMYVDFFLESFDTLGHATPNEAGPSVSRSSPFVGQKAFSDSPRSTTEAPTTSLNPEHASTRPSQQDTEIWSFKSELTVQNDCDVDPAWPIQWLSKEEPAEQTWQDVQRGKRSKRHQRSGDSQNSRSSSGHGHRKHVKLDSGRESPPPSNYFGPLLTLEPATLP